MATPWRAACSCFSHNLLGEEANSRFSLGGISSQGRFPPRAPLIWRCRLQMWSGWGAFGPGGWVEGEPTLQVHPALCLPNLAFLFLNCKW